MADNSTNPLVEYENLIQNGGIDNLYRRFLTDKDYLGGNFTTEAEDTFTVPEQDEYGEWYFNTESFQDRLNAIFNNAYKNSTQAFSSQLSIITINEDLKYRAKFYLDVMYYLYTQIPNIKASNAETIAIKWVLKAISFLQEKYPSLVSSHPAFTLLYSLKEDEAGDGIFDFKGVVPDLSRLFKLLCDLNLFTEDETNAEDFLKVFTSPAPNSLGIKLKFACTLEKATYIFEKMQIYFRKLTDIAVAESGLFKTKQNKGISYSSFHRRRSIYKDDPSKEDEREEIDKAFINFKITKR